MANIFRPSTWLRNKAETSSSPTKGHSRSHTGGAPETTTELDEPGLKASEGPEMSTEGSPELSMRERIEQRAYFLWCEAGCPEGQDVNYWLAAERELLEESQQD